MSAPARASRNEAIDCLRGVVMILMALWIGVVLALYPACRWFADVKRNSQAAWLSYL